MAGSEPLECWLGAAAIAERDWASLRGIYNCKENQSYTKDLVIKDLQEKLGINLRQFVEIESSG